MNLSHPESHSHVSAMCLMDFSVTLKLLLFSVFNIVRSPLSEYFLLYFSICPFLTLLSCLLQISWEN